MVRCVVVRILIVFAVHGVAGPLGRPEALPSCAGPLGRPEALPSGYVVAGLTGRLRAMAAETFCTRVLAP